MYKTCYVVCPKKLFSDYRVAVVLGTFISDQVGPCHSDIMNDSQSIMPFLAASKHFGGFDRNVFLSVRMSLALFALRTTDSFIQCVTGGCDDSCSS